MNFISIDRESRISLSKQLYMYYKESILNGNLKSNDKLPSTRELSRDLNIARNVVLDCYEQLIAEGYAYTKNGSGTYICEGVKFQPIKIKTESQFNKSDDDIRKISFRTGIPDLDNIPINKWAQMYKESILNLEVTKMDYQNSFGSYELRSQLSTYLERVRGVNTLPDNILITNGAAQAFSLLCKLVDKHEYALVENPLSYGILHTLESNHVSIKPIRVDEQGMVTSELPKQPPKLIFTTPSHQFPTGVVLPINRRIEMIKYAKKHWTYIVEDDYDSEFRFDGDPIQSMQYLDPEQVIYVGTFSKTLMPALRIGYMVLPDKLLSKIEAIKYVADLHSPNFEQITLAKFIETGLFDRHINKMRRLYLKKRNYLIKCLKKELGERVMITGAQAGMHFAAAFKDVTFDKDLMRKIEEKNIEITAMNKHYILDNSDFTIYNTLIFGYGNTKVEQMEKGIKMLADIIK
ncbi:transcriptional regulator, GntR family with aminotransferase domain containing protein [Clostridium sp. DL-VIII]|uniref:MocR-like pyridoxine biosynthesis transcription factor PdxR n=1 Tax=Clostridium sp. DL-VIII TaxID=641107 RepID=UPI00023AFBBA|nr:PLP-dependent aminotransferase family protein [Clostridium sp. DL-VIII]EHI99484.1 transcriptional regulator, GntR family with aminotransferase domain containing protein [Clostridium sp. DL-VIII]